MQRKLLALDNSISNTLGKTAQLPTGGISLVVNGVFNNPTHGPSARHGDTLDVAASTTEGGPTPVSYQWHCTQSGLIAGATLQTIVVDADLYDEQTLLCRVSLDNGTTVSTQGYVVRHHAPTVAMPIDDQILDASTGDYQIAVAGLFTGNDLQYSVSGGTAQFDDLSASVIISTDAPDTGSQITLAAQNSGGSAQNQFFATIEIDTSEDITVYFAAQTPAGGNPVPVTGTAILSGDAQGHWDIIDQTLCPSETGDLADLSQGPYVLALDDESIVTVNITQQISATDWALSSPREDGFDIVVFNVPGGATDLEISVNAGAWSSLETIVPGIYSLDGLEPETAYRVSLRGFSGSGGAVSSKSIATVPQDPRGFRGWSPLIDLGTQGDLYVAPFGDDSASGSEAAPLRTINAAVAQATEGQVIKIRAGKYREMVTPEVSTTFEGYGTEKPEITASEIIEGFTQCDGSDVDQIGPLLASANSPVYKTTIAKAAIEHDAILGLNLYEAGKRMFPATDRFDDSDLFNDIDKNSLHTADSLGLNVDGRVVSITDESVFRSSYYTQDQLLAADVLLLHYPSVVSRIKIQSVDFDTQTITFDGTYRPQTAGTDLDKYALTNVGPRLKPGTYYVQDHGDTITLFIIPYQVSNLDQIEFSARPRVFVFPASVDNINLRGLHVSRASGSGAFRGVNIYKGDITTRTDNHVIEHVLCTGVFNSTDPARSIRLNNTGYTTLSNITYHDLMNGVGVFLSGGGTTKENDVIVERHPGTHNIISKSYFSQITRTPYVVYQQLNMVFAHLLAERASLGAHANKTNAYEQCDNVLWWGVEFGSKVQGYLTWQEASQVSVAFSLLPVYASNFNNQRVIADQANFTAPPTPNSNGYIFNNTILPQIGNTYQGPSVALSNGLNDMSMTITNNIAQSITAPPHVQVPYDLFQGNIVTRLVTGVNDQTIADFPAGNIVETNMANVYVDYESGDFIPTANSPILTLAGYDMRTVVAALQNTYPHFTDFDRDYKNQLIDWDMLPIGADTGLNFLRTPELSNPEASVNSATEASGSIVTNIGNGTLYAGLWDSNTPPADASELIAGTGAQFHAFTPLNASGQHGYLASGLTSNQTLTWHFLHETSTGTARIVGATVVLSSTGSLGPNLMPDPGFDTPDHWTTNNGHSIVGGQLIITGGAASFSSTATRAPYNITATGNTTYEFSVDVVAALAGERLRVFITEYETGATLNTIEAFDTKNSGALSAGGQIIFQISTQAATDELGVIFNKIAGLDVVFDNISCRVVP
jgi:hypothetical protein